MCRIPKRIADQARCNSYNRVGDMGGTWFARFKRRAGVGVVNESSPLGSFFGGSVSFPPEKRQKCKSVRFFFFLGGGVSGNYSV